MVGLSHLQVLCLSDVHCPCQVSYVTQLNIREVQFVFIFTAPNIQKKHDHFTSNKMVLWVHFLLVIPEGQRKGRNLCLSGFTWIIALPRSLPRCLSPAYTRPHCLSWLPSRPDDHCLEFHRSFFVPAPSILGSWEGSKAALLCSGPFRGYWSRWENSLRLGVTLQELKEVVSSCQ